jgi:hypothetical protein
MLTRTTSAVLTASWTSPDPCPRPLALQLCKPCHRCRETSCASDFRIKCTQLSALGHNCDMDSPGAPCCAHPSWLSCSQLNICCTWLTPMQHTMVEDTGKLPEHSRKTKTINITQSIQNSLKHSTSISLIQTCPHHSSVLAQPASEAD